jgi:cytochrome P450
MNVDSMLRYIAGDGIEWAKDSLNFPVKVAAAGKGTGQFRLFHKRFVSTVDCDVAHQILTDKTSLWVRGKPTRNLELAMGESVFTTDGELWKSHHEKVLPPFKNAEITHRFDEIWQVVSTFTNQLLEMSASSPEQSVCQQAKYLTHATIHRVLFERKLLQGDSEQWTHWIDKVLEHVVARNTSVFNLPIWVPTPSNRALRGVRSEFKGYIKEAVVEYLNRPDAEGAMIGVAKQLDAVSGCPFKRGDEKVNERLLDEVLTLYVAGFETTSLVLAWALYYIANNPNVQETLFHEIDDNLHGQPPTADSLKSLPYLNSVINETLRIQPPVHLIPKVNTQDTTLGNGVAVPKGTIALVSIYGIHRNPKYWDEPGTFNPDRFRTKSDASTQAFFPFAQGTHTCLGSHLAIMELKLALIAISQNFILEPISTDIHSVAKVLLTPDRDILVRFSAR